MSPAATGRLIERLRTRTREAIHPARSLVGTLEQRTQALQEQARELDEARRQAEAANVAKSQFLATISHEVRTPLNSILALTRFLLDGTDGKLGEEQIKQVGFIRKSAENLSELVNDLLDLAKVEAGKTVVRPSEFAVQSLFGALRGMLRPLS